MNTMERMRLEAAIAAYSPEFLANMCTRIGALGESVPTPKRVRLIGVLSALIIQRREAAERAADALVWWRKEAPDDD